MKNITAPSLEKDQLIDMKFNRDGSQFIVTRQRENITFEVSQPTPGWHIPAGEALLNPADPLAAQLAKLGIEVTIFATGGFAIPNDPNGGGTSFWRMDTTRGQLAAKYGLPVDYPNGTLANLI